MQEKKTLPFLTLSLWQLNWTIEYVSSTYFETRLSTWHRQELNYLCLAGRNPQNWNLQDLVTWLLADTSQLNLCSWQADHLDQMAACYHFPQKRRWDNHPNLYCLPYSWVQKIHTRMSREEVPLWKKKN